MARSFSTPDNDHWGDDTDDATDPDVDPATDPEAASTPSHTELATALVQKREEAGIEGFIIDALRASTFGVSGTDITEYAATMGEEQRREFLETYPSLLKTRGNPDASPSGRALDQRITFYWEE